MKDDLVLLKRDILVKPLKYQEVHQTSIIVVDDESSKRDAAQFFEVLQVSKEVTMIKKGDTIVIHQGMHTIPMLWEDVMCAITSEDDVLAVLGS
jgi:co-chaperonin GroES (HSP10)